MSKIYIVKGSEDGIIGCYKSLRKAFEKGKTYLVSTNQKFSEVREFFNENKGYTNVIFTLDTEEDRTNAEICQWYTE